MLGSTTAALLALGALARAQTPPYPPAPVTSGNPLGASYAATLPNLASTTIRGSVVGTTGPGGVGVAFQVKLTGLPTPVGGPFLYHIHESPVPADGNCTGTGAHLDPLARGEDPPCDAAAPATCQVGDLAGKHGKPPGPGIYAVAYADPYVASLPGSNAFFGDKSIVVHWANKTRITCANFTLVSAGVGNASTTGAGSGAATGTTTYTIPTPSTSIITGAGAVAGASVGAAALALAALLLG